MKSSRFAQLLSSETPLLLPVAHDALTARLIERAGFAAASIGGGGVAAFRFGLPDLGLVSFGEMSAAVRDISSATTLPLVVDADDGYGDVKNVARTVQTYEKMGIMAIVLEDQASPKKCGHMAVERHLVSVEEATRKLAAALGARSGSDLAIIARTDARSVEGLDAALERAQCYEAIGVDALLVEAPTSIDELRIIGQSFKIPLMVNAAEGGKTPILSPAEYRDLGFSMIVYPGTLLLRMVGMLGRTLAALRAGQFADEGPLPEFSEFTEVAGMKEWMAIDGRFK